ncbi:hypothetical protein Vadar_005343 [Vaccinium darrowii]|uniref:Uncharacterized protein n=1 Tax=Vaccinium darrowii TaxID=229202 RepID=A0ACB7ZHK8_9ERIC|nr:hypothetical protein Vadar_005343 [Vaccinium darrowii]
MLEETDIFVSGVILALANDSAQGKSNGVKCEGFGGVESWAISGYEEVHQLYGFLLSIEIADYDCDKPAGKGILGIKKTEEGMAAFGYFIKQVLPQINEDEISDDYPLPAFYKTSIQETDEYVTVDGDFHANNLDEPHRPMLHNWALYNTDFRLISLELLPMESCADIDATIYGSGVMTADDGTWFSLDVGTSSSSLGENNVDGIPIYLSATKQWIIEFGSSMVSISIRTDMVWYRLGKPSKQYIPWYRTILKTARLAISIITLLKEQSRVSRLSFQDIIKRVSEFDKKHPAYISSNLLEVERYVVVHGQIILQQFAVFPDVHIKKCAFVSLLHTKMKGRHHRKWLVKNKAQVKRKVNLNPRAAITPTISEREVMPATTTKLINRLWVDFYSNHVLEDSKDIDMCAEEEDEIQEEHEEDGGEEVEEDDEEKAAVMKEVVGITHEGEATNDKSTVGEVVVSVGDSVLLRADDFANAKEVFLTYHCLDFELGDVKKIVVVELRLMPWGHQHRNSNAITDNIDRSKAEESKSKGPHRFIENEDNETFKNGRNVGLKAFLVCQMLDIEGVEDPKSADPASTKIKITRFFSPADISPEKAYGSDLREVYYSDEIVIVPLTAIEGKCEVLRKQENPFLDAPAIFQHIFFCEKIYDYNDGAIKQLSAHIKFSPSKERIVDEATKSKNKGKCIEGESNFREQNDVSLVKGLATLDIFAGCGGLSEDLQQSGVSQTKWAIENEDNAGMTFKLNHPEALMLIHNCNVILRAIMAAYGDEDDCISTAEATQLAAKLDEETINNLPRPGQVDFIIGGPPCQGFSGMNRHNQSGWSKVQCEMILAFLSFADYFRPRFFFLENVRNIVSHNKGKTFRLTLASLLEMGYQVRFGVLEARAYGVSQSRKRAFIWAASPEETLPEWPEPMHVFSGPELKIALNGSTKYVAVRTKRHNQWKGLFGRLDWEGNFPTSITYPNPMGKVGMCFHPEQDRILTVRECARSQGFPDRYRFAGSIVHKRRQIGNAVPPPLAFALGRKLKEAVEKKFKK